MTMPRKPIRPLARGEGWHRGARVKLARPQPKRRSK